MHPDTKRLKRAAKAAGMPLRKYAKKASEAPAHPLGAAARAWLDRKAGR